MWDKPRTYATLQFLSKAQLRSMGWSSKYRNHRCHFVFEWGCVNIHDLIYIYIHMYIYIFTHTYIYIILYIYIFTHIYIILYIYTHIYIYYILYIYILYNIYGENVWGIFLRLVVMDSLECHEVRPRAAFGDFKLSVLDCSSVKKPKGRSILRGGLEHFLFFHSVGNGIIIPTDELHHFSEG